ncbi:MAG: hypothetical protein A2340_09860 [Lentisphaerae bacterium RIFOXYB12_FULL_60_10]|nr:MAG: hypothetical protein A2269_02170 [Lentisphaerae bacterium RIFOXYA12_FULL_60_10]OGV85928.1 MAG: hypothetical protein A2340_09860 [Lentisphaerae bacterium RIFOXYB12_FULL_60_10]
MQAIQWTLDSKDPVIKPGQLHPGIDDQHAGAGHVLDLGDRFRIYYWGAGPKGNVILMAESPVDRPNDWKPVGGVLLAAQPDTDHNFGGPSFPFVVRVDARKWLMVFCSWGKPRPDGKLPNATNLAISDDAGLTWRYHDANPIIPMNRPWDGEATGSVSVVRAGDRWRMYYTAIGKYYARPEGVQTGHGDRIPRIGVAVAESRDGVRWEKHESGLVLAPREFKGNPYEYINSKPFVLREPDGWRMWFSSFGTAYRIQEAWSEDGLTWQHQCPKADDYLGIGAAGTFDDHQRSYAVVVRRADDYHLWYTGNGFGKTGMGYARGRIGG